VFDFNNLGTLTVTDGIDPPDVPDPITLLLLATATAATSAWRSSSRRRLFR
jgi:hypothetical protein